MDAGHEIDPEDHNPPEEEWMQELLWPPSSSHLHRQPLQSPRPLDAASDHPLLPINGRPPPPPPPQRTKEKHQLSRNLMQQKVALETKSDIDILDDGFKWRKYGQKSVKNSKHPRSYYRCSIVGCPVKKRVERSTLDPALVVTTYHNMHNHHSPTTHNMESSWFPFSQNN